MNRPHLRPVSSSAASVRRPATPCAVSGRSGVTLTEVLMSLLVMGLGITSVFTLFPMSVLRSVKSTNLTNATLLSQSARDLYLAYEDTLLIPPSPSTSTTYAKDQLLTVSIPVPDGQIPDPFIGTFVVDPYGGKVASDYGATPGKFGEQTPGGAGSWGVLRVANGLGETGNPLNSFVSSKDSWVTAFEEAPIADPVAVTAPNPTHDISFSGIDLNSAANSQSRVLITSANRKRSLVRELHPTTPIPSATSIRLASALPDDMNELSEIGTIRLQNYERRYTWLLTVHRDRNGGTTKQIVVFFRRGFGESEQLYQITGINPNPPDRSRKIIVTGYTEGIPKPGDYIFGTWEVSGTPRQHHGRWYRILLVKEVSSSTGSGNYEITLDRSWVGGTRPGTSGNGNNPMVMFPKGVVSVFDL